MSCGVSTGYWPLPVRHGHDTGELARLFAGEARIPVQLHVVPMQHYRRGQWYEASGLPWLPPSPTCRHGKHHALPGSGDDRGSRGVGGPRNAHALRSGGCPWIDGPALSRALNAACCRGCVSSRSASPPPRHLRGPGLPRCAPARAGAATRSTPPALGLVLAAELHRRYPERFSLERTLRSVGARSALAQFAAARPARNPVRRSKTSWLPDSAMLIYR